MLGNFKVPTINNLHFTETESTINSTKGPDIYINEINDLIVSPSAEITARTTEKPKGK